MFLKPADRGRWLCRCRGITFIGASFKDAWNQAYAYLCRLEASAC